MKIKKTCVLSIRMEPEQYEKLCQIAESDGRYVSQLAAWWLRGCIREYEERCGFFDQPKGPGDSSTPFGRSE